MSNQSIKIQPNLLISLTLACLTMGFASLVFAEAADRDKPIDLEADSVKVDDAKQISTYSGNVILKQGTLIIRADKLVVREDSAGFQHSTSTGNPTTFKQKREGKNEYMEGSALRIEYDGRMDKVQLYTNAWVKRGEDIVHGNYISYDANTEYAEVIGGTKSADGVTTGSGRVHAIIQPKNKKATDPATEAPKNTGSGGGSSSISPLKDTRFSRTISLPPEVKSVDVEAK